MAAINISPAKHTRDAQGIADQLAHPVSHFRIICHQFRLQLFREGNQQFFSFG